MPQSCAGSVGGGAEAGAGRLPASGQPVYNASVRRRDMTPSPGHVEPGAYDAAEPLRGIEYTNGGVMLNPVSALLKSKGDTVHTVTPTDKVSVAVRKMAQVEIGALPVIEQGKLVGIFSERDVLIRIVDQGLNPDTTPVADVMTPSPKSITASQEVREAMRLMSKGRFRHLPVVDGDALVGLISIRDAMEWVIRDQEQVIDELIGTVRMAPPSHRVRG
jgi:CBS domain-containing protein